LRIAAISFLNPAPLMWDFEHEPHLSLLAQRYDIRFMVPSRCADELAARTADIGLVPIAALPRDPGMRILPGCTIASKGKVLSLLLVRRAHQALDDLRSVAADTASRTTLTYARMLFHRWGNPEAIFYPMAADLDAMLANADAAIVIGDPALLALEDRDARLARTGEELVYHDLAEEWRLSTGLPFISAIWGIACSGATAPGGLSDESIAADMIASRDRGLAHLDVLAREWAQKLPLSEAAIRSYLSGNIHYILDEECVEGMRGFFRYAAELDVLPAYELPSIKI
jgi:chorismate dehydratase